MPEIAEKNRIVIWGTLAFWQLGRSGWWYDVALDKSTLVMSSAILPGIRRAIPVASIKRIEFARVFPSRSAMIVHWSDDDEDMACTIYGLDRPRWQDALDQLGIPYAQRP